MIYIFYIKVNIKNDVYPVNVEIPFIVDVTLSLMKKLTTIVADNKINVIVIKAQVRFFDVFNFIFLFILFSLLSSSFNQYN